MSGNIDFVVPRRFNPKNVEDQFFLANRIAAIRYGDHHQDSPAEMYQGGSMIQIHPATNDHWLVLPGHNGLDDKHFRLVSRYDDHDLLVSIISILQKCT